MNGEDNEVGLVCVGRLSREKRPDVAIETLRSLPLPHMTWRPSAMRRGDNTLTLIAQDKADGAATILIADG